MGYAARPATPTDPNWRQGMLWSGYNSRHQICAERPFENGRHSQLTVQLAELDLGSKHPNTPGKWVFRARQQRCDIRLHQAEQGLVGSASVAWLMVMLLLPSLPFTEHPRSELSVAVEKWIAHRVDRGGRAGHVTKEVKDI